MAEPPVLVGAVKATDTWPFPMVAVPIEGAAGTDAVDPLVAADSAPVPTALLAETRQLYVVAFARSLMVIGLAVPVAVEAVPVGGEQVAVNSVIGEPPVAPAVKLTVSCPTPVVTDEIVGALGTVTGVTVTVPEAGEVPTLFFAFTEQV